MPTISSLPQGIGLTRQYALFLGTGDKSAVDEDHRTIREVLDSLHAKYPLLNYAQYEDQLQHHGISYLVTAAVFGVEFFITRVGMKREAANIFCKWVKKEHKRAQKARKSKRECHQKKRPEGSEEDKQNVTVLG